MKYKIFRSGLIILFLSVFVFTPLMPSLAEEDSAPETEYGLNPSTEETNGLKTGDPEPIIGNIVGSVLAFVGVLFFILVVYGGLLWMTARGNEQQIEKAKNLIGSAVVGLIIVLSAYAITAFIGSALTG